MNNGHGELRGSGIRAENGYPFDRALRVPGATQTREIAVAVAKRPPDLTIVTHSVCHRLPDPQPATMGRHWMDRGSKREMN